MREVNFSIPSANKASVGITNVLYDRRALDTTSNLPLINSLNNLAYLTTSSARIRDILTVDGGVERLVCILKEGRNTKDMMEGWKWNLAFQCVVNIGVRGSEGVRTRVVEADMVPVIATLLDNYVRVIDKCRAKAEMDYSKTSRSEHKKKSSSKKKGLPEHTHDSGAERSRRNPPPPIAIPSNQPDSLGVGMSDSRDLGPQGSLSSPPERTTFSRGHSHQRSLQGQVFGSPGRPNFQPLATSVPVIDAPQETGLRPVRDIDRLPSMLPGLQAEFAQPDSPTTPNGLAQLPGMLNPRASPSRQTRRPNIRHQLSISSQSDMLPEEPAETPADIVPPEAAVHESEIQVQDIESDDMDTGGSPVRLEPPAPPPADVDTLDMARSALESTATGAAPTGLSMSPVPNPLNPPAQQAQSGPYTRFITGERDSKVLSAMPSDGDVLMCLQLLAYVSKYCNLRKYFQQSHLVPRLKIRPADLALLDGASAMQVDEEPSELELEEYLQPDDFNIFPLVEKFTVRHHNADMQYWARVVMRNLCRKDDARGGIRQCAYWQCGKWEKYTREFAKCRRCRRTKYCSKECQKSAWVFHRHWCVEAQS